MSSLGTQVLHTCTSGTDGQASNRFFLRCTTTTTTTKQNKTTERKNKTKPDIHRDDPVMNVDCPCDDSQHIDQRVETPPWNAPQNEFVQMLKRETPALQAKKSEKGIPIPAVTSLHLFAFHASFGVTRSNSHGNHTHSNSLA